MEESIQTIRTIELRLIYQASDTVLSLLEQGYRSDDPLCWRDWTHRNGYRLRPEGAGI